MYVYTYVRIYIYNGSVDMVKVTDGSTEEESQKLTLPQVGSQYVPCRHEQLSPQMRHFLK